MAAVSWRFWRLRLSQTDCSVGPGRKKIENIVFGSRSKIIDQDTRKKERIGDREKDSRPLTATCYLHSCSI